ncbi:MAG: metal ABC transporter ATP-binding protein [Clostridia bacterium]|nr:metal ABC transporter ATP-binding protein [Clostridia bacterium]
MAQITCKNLSLGYDSNVIIKDLNFSVNEGDYLAIVGENGSGKSTLMKTVLGLIKPLGGEILTGDGVKKNEIGYLPQQTVVQRDFPASVWEVVISGCLSRTGLRPFYNLEEKETARENIEKMGLKGFEKRSYKELSGGQQQRVLLARALCATRKVLLLDEPVSGLDPIVTAEMYELIYELNKSGTTIIMISHDISAAIEYASHILHIGSDIFFGTKEEYLSSDKGKTFIARGDGK